MNIRILKKLRKKFKYKITGINKITGEPTYEVIDLTKHGRLKKSEYNSRYWVYAALRDLYCTTTIAMKFAERFLD